MWIEYVVIGCDIEIKDVIIADPSIAINIKI
jgi:hypothetical protein